MSPGGPLRGFSHTKVPQPFYREDRRRWYFQLDGKHFNLGPDEQPAFVEHHEVMAARGNALGSVPDPSPQPVPPNSPLISVVLDAYLGWFEKNRSPRTLEGYRWHLQRSLSAPPGRHLEDWVNCKKGGEHAWIPTLPGEGCS